MDVESNKSETCKESIWAGRRSRIHTFLSDIFTQRITYAPVFLMLILMTFLHKKDVSALEFILATVSSCLLSNLLQACERSSENINSEWYWTPFSEDLIFASSDLCDHAINYFRNTLNQNNLRSVKFLQIWMEKLAVLEWINDQRCISVQFFNLPSYFVECFYQWKVSIYQTWTSTLTSILIVQKVIRAWSTVTCKTTGPRA